MRWYSIVCLLLGLPMFALGMMGTVLNLAEPDDPEFAISLADYITQKPEGMYLKLTDCALSIDEGYCNYKQGDVVEPVETVFIPLRAPGASPDAPVHVVFQTTSRKYRNAAYDLLHAKTPERIDAAKLEHLHVLAEIRDIEGHIYKGGMPTNPSDVLTEFHAKLAPGYWVITERRPLQLNLSLWLLGGGTLALILVRLTTGKKSATQNPPPTPQKQ